jgi:hypothetical protein
MLFLRFIYFIIIIALPSCYPTKDLLSVGPVFTPELSQEAINKCLEENTEVSKKECALKDCLSAPLTLLAMHELLIETASVLDELNIYYWIDSGSAIAAERFNAHLPWDDDVDLGIFSHDFDENKEALFTQKIYERGFEFKPLIGTKAISSLVGRQGLIQVAYRESRFKRLVLSVKPHINPADLHNLWLRYERAMSFLPHLDIFLFDESRAGSYAYKAKHFRDLQMTDAGIPKAYLFGPQKIDILGRSFNAVQNFIEYGKIMYKTDNLLLDFYISREHSLGCKKIRLKDIRNHEEILGYLISYLDFVYSLPAAKAMGAHFDSTQVKARFGLK